MVGKPGPAADENHPDRRHLRNCDPVVPGSAGELPPRTGDAFQSVTKISGERGVADNRIVFLYQLPIQLQPAGGGGLSDRIFQGFQQADTLRIDRMAEIKGEACHLGNLVRAAGKNLDLADRRDQPVVFTGKFLGRQNGLGSAG